jgi:hypothetical protein
MPSILSANTLSGGFGVANSLRFNDGDSPALTRSLGTTTLTTKGTFSFWVKRGQLTTAQMIYTNEVADDNNRGQILFEDDDTFMVRDSVSGSNTTLYKTTQKFRDVGAWYHMVVALDSTEAGGNRIRVYKNGTRIPDANFVTSTEPNQNAAFKILTGGQTNKNHIGKVHGGSNHFDGYLAEFVYCDGQVLDASSFGEFDEDSPNVWKPISVSGLTMGDQGFYLDFEDSSALGNDKAGSNNFGTVTNLAAVDQTTDTCTNNFATMNSLDNFYAGSTFSEGNCRVVTGSTPETWNTSTFGLSSGKWYMEFTIIDQGSGGSTLIGIADRPTVSASEELGGLATTYAYLSSGNFRTNNSNTSNSVSAANGDIIGVALDLDSGQNTISYYKNNTLIVAAQNITAPVSGNYFIASGVWLDNDTGTNDHNFGNPVVAHSSAASDANGYGSFEFAPPSGYYAICTKNIAEFG